MEAWVIATIGVVVGIGVSKGLDAIGWAVRNVVQRRRDAANVAKKIYDSQTRIGGEEAKEKEEIEGANVERYGRIYRKLKREFKKKD